MIGRILYDADCRMCRDMMRRFEKTFTARGFTFVPIQSEMKPGDQAEKMRVRTNDGRVFGGADAVLFLARFVWWGWPLRLFAKIPSAKKLLRQIYREIAARRTCDNGACQLPEMRR